MSKSPDFERAIVDQTKIVEYLLGASGPGSIAKARFFGSLGFSVERWEVLAEALRGQAAGAPQAHGAISMLRLAILTRLREGGTRLFQYGLKKAGACGW